MIILCCGDRNWNDKKTIKSIIKSLPRHVEIIHGNANGADKQSRDVAEKLGFKTTPYSAKWHIFGKGAGPRRNIEMLDKKPSIIFAFHNDINSSVGTKHCIIEATRRKIPVYLISKTSKINVYKIGK